MLIFPLQSNNMSRVDNWVHPIAHTALSRHFKMSTTKIIFTHFKTYWFFSTITVSWKWCFVCNGEKKSLLHIAQKEMYLNLQSPLCIFFIPSNLLNIFNSNFNILYIFLFGIMRKTLLHIRPNLYYHWTVRFQSHRALASKEQKGRKLSEMNLSELKARTIITFST